MSSASSSSRAHSRERLYDCILLLNIYIIATLQLFVYDLCIFFTGKTTNQTNVIGRFMKRFLHGPIKILQFLTHGRIQKCLT